MHACIQRGFESSIIQKGWYVLRQTKHSRAAATLACSHTRFQQAFFRLPCTPFDIPCLRHSSTPQHKRLLLSQALLTHNPCSTCITPRAMLQLCRQKTNTVFASNSTATHPVCQAGMLTFSSCHSATSLPGKLTAALHPSHP